MTSNFEPEYFARQLAKSDTKLRWQYDRMLGFAGVRLPIGAHALDIGCGAAPGLRYLARRGIIAVGCDVSAAALAAARRAMAGAELVLCDLNEGLPFTAGRFDLVLMSEIVEHVADVALVLGEIRRVLQPGGAFVLTTPNLWDPRRAVAVVGGPTWTGDTDPTHINLQTPRTLRRHLERAGFAQVPVRVGGRRLPIRFEVPYPPLIGNGIMACGRA